MDKSLEILSDIIVYMKYAKYDHKKKRRETWEEIIDRNKAMHIKKFPQLKEEIEEAYKLVYQKKVLPSMRSLQFAGKPIELNNLRLYNCGFEHMSHPDAFKELMFLLLSGCGDGFSVQRHHISQLPEIRKPKKSYRYLIADSLEGWASAVGALTDAYMGNRKSLPRFDFGDIRPKGAPLKTSGGIAPGPEPLKTCLHHVQTILDRKSDGEQLKSIEVYDICCYLSDAVLSGGIRRSAMICLFSFDDEEMRTCKIGKFYEKQPQRQRSNNSAVILRHKITEEEFFKYWDLISKSKSGEPGIFFTNDQEFGTNPCGEIALRDKQLCNLVECNAKYIRTQEELNEIAKVASFIATLQASYTDFHFLREEWKTTTDKEALIGVGLTGIASSNIIDLNLKEAAEIVKLENAKVAKIIGINSAARCTTVKPSGTASLVLGCSSGIHAWHYKYFIKNIRVTKEEPIYKYLSVHNAELVQDDYFKPDTQAIISVPLKAPEGSIIREDETALQFLARIKKVFKNWIVPGHIKGHNYNNISATVNIKENEWERVGKWMWDNRDSFTALSVLPYDNGEYIQAPWEEIDQETYEKMYKKLKEINLTNVIEDRDNTSLKEQVACSGGKCEI